MKHKSFLDRKVKYYSTLFLDRLLVAVCYNTILAYILKYVTNAVVNQRLGDYKIACYLAAGTFLVAFIFQPIISRNNNVEIKHSMTRLRKKVFSMLCHSKLSNVEKMGIGDMMTRMTIDIDTIELMYQQYIPLLMFTVTFGVISITSMLVENLMIACCAIMLGLLSVWCSNRISKRIERDSKNFLTERSNLSKHVIDMNDGWMEIRRNVCESHFIHRFARVNQLLQEAFIRRERQTALLELVAIFFQNLNDIGLIALGVILVMKGKITVGSVLALLHLNGNASFFFQNLSSCLGGVRKCKPSIERVHEVLNAEIEDLHKEEEELDKNEESSKIQISGLSFEYEAGQKVLDQVSLTIPEGKFISLEGESGSGKSTLIKLLLGLYETQAGTIKQGNEPMDEAELRRKISYVPQDYYLYQMTIYENVRLGKLTATKEEIVHACILAGAHEFIQQQEQGYDTMVASMGGNLSGGQCQRIALARAILRDSPFYVLDEATAALDEVTESQIKEVLHRLKKTKGILCISHRKAMIEGADVRYRLEHGVLSEVG